MVPLLAEKLRSRLSEIFPCPTWPPGRPLVAHRGASAVQPGQQLPPRLASGEGSAHAVAKIIFLSPPAAVPRTCKNSPSPTPPSNFVQRWPVWFKNLAVGRVGQQMNSTIARASFPSQMMCAGVMPLWGGGCTYSNSLCFYFPLFVFRYTLKEFVTFMIRLCI